MSSAPLRARARPALRRHQRGVALIIVTLIIVLGVSWLLVSALSTWLNPAAANPTFNGRVLGEAKAALLGYVANEVMDDLTSNPERNPGRLPCPEYYSCQSSSGSCTPPPSPADGVAAAACPPPAVGRLPWRTLGIDEPFDASGTPLWYVVSPDWALPSTTATLTINFNTSGQLTFNGQSNAAVGLIIAPGSPLAVPASTTGNCPARTQNRGSSPPDYRDYFECPNAAWPIGVDGFAASGAVGAFNDQVVQVTPADVMRAIEGPIAQRIQTQIVPAINSVYTAANGWYDKNGNLLSQPLYPFAAPFNSPNPAVNPPNPGVVNNYEGVLPIKPDAASSVAWVTASVSASVIVGPNPKNIDCSNSTSNSVQCTFDLRKSSSPQTLQVTASASKVGIGFRQPPGLLANVSYAGLTLSSASIQNTLVSDGTAQVVYQAVAPAAGGKVTVSIGINAADDSITDANNSATGWFIRNQWYMFTYYAVSGRYAPGGNEKCAGGPASTPCLTMYVDGVPNNNVRALLVFAGRFLTGVNTPLRPMTGDPAIGDPKSYFEGYNLRAATNYLSATPPSSFWWVFDKHSAATSAFNDRTFSIAP